MRWAVAIITCYAAGFGVVTWMQLGPPAMSYQLSAWSHANWLLEEINPSGANVAEVNKWLAHDDTVDPALIKSLPAHQSVAPLDPWGQPFRAVRNDGELGVFSGGPDKHSSSLGNDRDDISTWREIHDEHKAVDHSTSLPRGLTYGVSAGTAFLMILVLLTKIPWRPFSSGT